MKSSKEKANDNSDEIWDLFESSDSVIDKKLILDISKNIKADVSGDIIFNFNDRKFKWFSEIVEKDKACSDQKKKVLNKMLIKCKELDKSPCNMSMILSTGGLNNFKQGISNDRFDVFIFEIFEYYKGKKLHILENGSSAQMCYANRMILERNLDVCGEGEDGFNSFLTRFYHINSKSNVTLSLLQSGKERIKDCNGVYRYLCQAFEYWELNANFYFNNENTKEYYCKFDSGCLPDKITKEYNNLLDKL